MTRWIDENPQYRGLLWAGMTPNEAYTLMKRSKGWTFTKIAWEIGLSKGRAAQIERSAKKKYVKNGGDRRIKLNGRITFHLVENFDVWIDDKVKRKCRREVKTERENVKKQQERLAKIRRMERKQIAAVRIATDRLMEKSNELLILTQ